MALRRWQPHFAALRPGYSSREGMRDTVGYFRTSEKDVLARFGAPRAPGAWRWASITAPATLYSPASPTGCRGGLRGASGSAMEGKIAANIQRGYGPKNRSAAVVLSGHVSRKLWTAARHTRFLGWSSPRSSWFRNAISPFRPSTWHRT
jgi:hypothetical protein